MTNTYVVQGGQLLSQEMLDLSTEIKSRYPNLGLAWIPPENRSTEDPKHWAIVQNNVDGDITDVIKELSEFECHPNFVLTWLWENDSTRMDPWEKYLKQVAAKKEQTRKENFADIEERAEKVHAIASSPLHTYRIDGKKIG